MIPSRRSKIRNWHSSTVSGGSDYLYIPEGQSNAFMGIVAFTENPTVGILDFDTCLANLRRNGWSKSRAYDFLVRKAKNREDYEPMIMYSYPELHPNIKEVY